jgi:hypothetical protein
MRDSKLALRTAYYTALKDAVTLGGYTVPVMDRIKSDTTIPYVKLSTQTAVPGPRGKRDCTVQDTTILLDIVTAYDGNRGGKQDADLIADQLLELLDPDDDTLLPDLGADFRLVSTVVESDIDLEEELPPSKILIRRLIRLRNQIEQLI